MHYSRWYKHGDTDIVLLRQPRRQPGWKTPENRTCLDCGHFGPSGSFPRGRNLCTPCNTRQKMAWRHANPGKHRASILRNAEATGVREERRKAVRLGVDPDVVDAYREGHSGGCDICGRECPSGRKLAIDHDHDTGAFRGLLCANCNRALGLLQDDAGRLRRAAEYLIERGGVDVGTPGPVGSATL